MPISVIHPVSLYVLLSLQMWVLGLAGLRQARLLTDEMKESTALYHGIALSLGFGLNAIVLFIYGLTGLLTLPWVTVWLLVSAIGATWLCRPMWKKPNYQDIMGWLPIAMLFVAIGLQAVRVPGFWDDTMYHLPIARSYVEANGLILNPFLRFPLFPQYMDLMLSLGLLLGGAEREVLAQGMATLPLFAAGLGLIGLSERYLQARWPGFLALYLMLSIQPVRDTLGYAYIDNGLLLFCWMALICAILALDEKKLSYPNLAWIGLAGGFAGMAIGTKYFGLPFVGLLGLGLLIMTRSVKATLVFGLSCILIGGGWYLRTYLLSGDPVHPAGGGFFGYYLWDASDLANQKAEQATFGVDKNILYVWSALKAAGSKVLVWVPLSLFLLPKFSKGMRLMVWVSLGYFLFWFYVTQVDRYLAPVAASGAFLAVFPLAYAWRLLSSKWLEKDNKNIVRMNVITSFACFILVCIPFSKAIKSFAIQYRDWSHLLLSQPGYALLEQANLMKSVYGSRLVHVGFERNVYFFKGTMIGDWFGPGRYSQMQHCIRHKCTLVSADKMQGLLKRFDAKMLMVNSDRVSAPDLEEYNRYFRLIKKDAYGMLFVER